MRLTSGLSTASAPVEISHIALTVNVLASMAAFYREAMGLTELSSEPGLRRLGVDGRPLVELREDPAARRAFSAAMMRGSSWRDSTFSMSRLYWVTTGRCTGSARPNRARTGEGAAQQWLATNIRQAGRAGGSCPSLGRLGALP